MEFGIRDAKNNLSRLVKIMRGGEPVYLTSRGSRVAQLTPVAPKSKSAYGRGAWKGRVNLYPGWDSEEEDLKIQETFLSDSE